MIMLRALFVDKRSINALFNFLNLILITMEFPRVLESRVARSIVVF